MRFTMTALCLTLWVSSPGCGGPPEPAFATRQGALTADRFQLPLNPPTASGYNKTAGWKWLAYEKPGVYHPGEDWNGNGGGNSDEGDPVYAIGSGEVTAAGAFGTGWGNIVVVKHELPNGENVWSVYAHLKEMTVSKGDTVAVGSLVGTIGRGHDNEYSAHLHLEVRTKDLPPSHWPKAKDAILASYLEPSVFIKAHEKPLEPCAVSSTGLTFIEETDACVERGGKYWWDAAGSGGHAFTTYTTDAGQPDSFSKWYLGIEQAGQYTIEIYVPDLPNLSKKAKYKLWLPGEQWVEVDQSKHRGEMVSLGTFSFAPGAALRLNDNTGEPYVGSSGPRLAVDAIRIAPATAVGHDPTALPAGDSGTAQAPQTAAADQTQQTGGCGTASPAPSLLWLLLFVRRRQRWLLVRQRLLAGLAALLVLGGCERGTVGDESLYEPPAVDDDTGIVIVGGIPRQLVPASAQVWGDLPDSWWAEPPVFGPELPQKVNHAPFQTPVREQVGQTCVDYAVVAGLEAVTHYESGSFPDVSEAHLAASHEDLSLQAALLAAQSTKLTTEEYWPATASSPKSGWEAHRVHGVKKFQAIPNPAASEVLRAHLAEGDDSNVILAMNHVATAWTNTGTVELPVGGTPSAWAHAVLLVGYERRKNASNKDRWFFRIKNSWGTGWGEAGYGWLSEDYVKTYVLAGAIVRQTIMPDAPASTCGDGVCTPPETCATCADCKCPPGTDCGAGGTCAKPGCTDTCSPGVSCSGGSLVSCVKGANGCHGTVTQACQYGCSGGACVAHPVAECTSGVCCNGGKFAPSTQVCEEEADAEWGCPWGTGCGDDVGVKRRPRHCSGKSASCTGTLGPWGGWTVAESCPATKACASSGSCKATSACSAAQCTCSNGPCCDGCDLKAAGTVCKVDASSEVACTWGTGCGADVAIHTRDRLCNGTTSACSGDYGPWKPWTLHADCGPSQVCGGSPASCTTSAGCSSAPCQCTSGPCCDGCNFKNAGTVCAPKAESEVGCPWGTGCGQSVAQKTRDRLCSGASAACDGPYGVWSDWSVVDACSDTEKCTPGKTSCTYTADCDAPKCECSSGACCDGCWFRPSTHVCDEETEVGCPSGAACGGDKGVRTRKRTCSGASGSCNGAWGSFSAWTVTGSCSTSQTCSGGSCVTSANCGDKCGNGTCESTETPKTCPSDCGAASFAVQPSLYYGNTPSSASLSCSSTASTSWHKGQSGGLPYWVFASNCGVPSTSSPTAYGGYNARWTFTIKKAGTYDINAWIPDQANACGFGADKLSQEVHYILTGSAKKQASGNQKASMGGNLAIFSGVSLGTGSHTLVLYDDAWGGCACNGAGCGTTSTRVFADTVGVNFKSAP